MKSCLKLRLKLKLLFKTKKSFNFLFSFQQFEQIKETSYSWVICNTFNQLFIVCFLK